MLNITESTPEIGQNVKFFPEYFRKTKNPLIISGFCSPTGNRTWIYGLGNRRSIR
jgi:hypothetical protein